MDFLALPTVRGRIDVMKSTMFVASLGSRFASATNT
jgi:hypothetical protein